VQNKQNKKRKTVEIMKIKDIGLLRCRGPIAERQKHRLSRVRESKNKPPWKRGLINQNQLLMRKSVEYFY
jgi:hypothetical protein